MSINIKLKLLLIEAFGSQIEAAKQIGIHESKLSRIIRGYAVPTHQEITALERNLGRVAVRKALKPPVERTSIPLGA